MYSYTHGCTNNSERDRNVDRSVGAERGYFKFRKWQEQKHRQVAMHWFTWHGSLLVSLGVLAEDRKVNVFQCLKGTKY